jgi:PAS domain S-box-containing protein
MRLRQGLTSRITMVFMVFAAVLLAGMGVMTYHNGRSSMESAAVSELLSTAIEKEWQINQWMSKQIADIESLAASPAILTMLNGLQAAPKNSRAQQQAREQLAAELLPRTVPKLFNTLAVVDTGGSILASTNSGLTGVHVAEEPFFKNSMYGPYVVPPHRSSLLKMPAIALGTPLRDTQGNLLGILVGWSNLSELNDILQHRTGLHRTDEAFLVNAEGFLLTQPRSNRQPGILTQKVDSAAVKDCILGNSGVALSRDEHGTPSVTVYRWLSRHKMGIIVKIAQPEAFASVQDFGDAIFIISLLALAASSYIAVLLARTITHPLRALRTGVARIHQGSLYVPLPARADDEVAQLTKEFNGMAAAILEKESQLRANAAQLEERVHERTRVLQQQANLLDLAYDAIIVTDLDGKVLFWNNGATEIYGWRKKEAIGQHNHAMLLTVFPSSYADIKHSLLQSGRWEGELQQMRRDGEDIVVATRKALQRDELGRPIAILSINTDITASKEAENILRVSEQRTRMIVDSAYDAFIAMDEDARIVDWNRQAEVMFGWRREEVMGKPVHEIIIPERHRQIQLREIQRLIATGAGAAIDGRVEIAGLRRSGREFMLELMLSPIRLGNGMTYSAFLRDITERKRAQQELQAAMEAAESAARAKSEFLANMSHEIRTPMNGIIGLTKLVMKTPLTQQQQEYLAMIDASAASLLRLVNDILDFSKIEARKLELDAVDFDVRELIGDCLKAFSASANEKGLELIHRVAADVPASLRGDPGRINQIMLNLVSNAIKFTRQGEIVVRLVQESLHADHAMLRLSVSDTGIGIAKEQQAYIFSAFSQADSSTTRIYGGTGLGLTIVSQLAALMGGRVWVESEPGAGTTFHLTLRLDLARSPPTEAPHTGLLKGMRVLIVDDNATNRLILGEIVGSWGMQPVLTADGQQALAELHADAARGAPFPLILLDSHMPGFDGFQLAEKIMAMPQHDSATIMMLSSANMPDEIGRCQALGITHFLRKPVKQSELFDAIAMAIGMPSAGQARLHTCPAKALPRPVRQLRVLIAEDHPINQRLISEIVAGLGHAFAIAENGNQVLAMLEQEHFDVILMDGQMPEMDGYQTAAAIRHRESDTGRHIHIIAVTAHAMPQDRELCLAAGMNDYVAKPIDPDVLAERLERLAGLLPADLPALPASRVPPILPPSPPAPAIIDIALALKRVRGKRELLNQMARVFLDDLPESVSAIQDAVQAGNAEQLERAAHRLKGAAAALSADRLVAVATRLEQQGRRHSVAHTASSVRELETSASELSAALENFIGDTP